MKKRNSARIQADVVTVSLEIPASLELQMRVTAAAQRISRSELIRRAIEAYLEQQQPKIESVGIIGIPNER